MTELQEPIVTIEPILGLGADYEPDLVWHNLVSGNGAPEGVDRSKCNALAVFESRFDAELAGQRHYLGARAEAWSLDRARAKAKSLGLSTVALLSPDDLHTIKFWSV